MPPSLPPSLSALPSNRDPQRPLVVPNGGARIASSLCRPGATQVPEARPRPADTTLIRPSICIKCDGRFARSGGGGVFSRSHYVRPAILQPDERKEEYGASERKRNGVSDVRRGDH
ncbi:hypothetical protein Q7P37_003248 [Cladosporium fusiforme]